MDENMAVRAIIAVFAVLLILNYVFPGASFFAYLVYILAIVAVLFLLRGIFEVLTGHDDVSLYAGIGVILILILFFNGFSVVMGAISFVSSVILTILSILGAAVLTLIP